MVESMLALANMRAKAFGSAEPILAVVWFVSFTISGSRFPELSWNQKWCKRVWLLHISHSWKPDVFSFLSIAIVSVAL